MSHPKSKYSFAPHPLPQETNLEEWDHFVLGNEISEIQLAAKVASEIELEVIGEKMLITKIIIVGLISRADVFNFTLANLLF